MTDPSDDSPERHAELLELLREVNRRQQMPSAEAVALDPAEVEDLRQNFMGTGATTASQEVPDRPLRQLPPPPASELRAFAAAWSTPPEHQ